MPPIPFIYCSVGGGGGGGEDGAEGGENVCLCMCVCACAKDITPLTVWIKVILKEEE